MNNLNPSSRISLVVLIVITATIAYAVLNNLVVVSISPEYFQELLAQNMGLNRLPSDATVASIYMGVIGSWWLAIFFALLIVLAGKIGSRREIEASEIARFLPIPLIMIFGISNFIGWLNYQVVDVDEIKIVGGWIKQFDWTEEQAASAWRAEVINSLAYWLGSAVAIGIAIQTWRARKMPAPVIGARLPFDEFFNTRIGAAVVTAAVSIVLVLLFLLVGPGLLQLLLFVGLAGFFLRLFFDLEFVYLRLGVFALGSVVASFSMTTLVGALIAKFLQLPHTDFTVPAEVYIGMIAFAAWMLWLHYKLHHADSYSQDVSEASVSAADSGEADGE